MVVNNNVSHSQTETKSDTVYKYLTVRVKLTHDIYQDTRTLSFTKMVYDGRDLIEHIIKNMSIGELLDNEIIPIANIMEYMFYYEQIDRLKEVLVYMKTLKQNYSCGKVMIQYENAIVELEERFSEGEF